MPGRFVEPLAEYGTALGEPQQAALGDGLSAQSEQDGAKAAGYYERHAKREISHSAKDKSVFGCVAEKAQQARECALSDSESLDRERHDAHELDRCHHHEQQR